MANASTIARSEQGRAAAGEVRGAASHRGDHPADDPGRVRLHLDGWAAMADPRPEGGIAEVRLGGEQRGKPVDREETVA